MPCVLPFSKNSIFGEGLCKAKAELAFESDEGYEKRAESKSRGGDAVRKDD
jgi:hypothetical protein